MTVDNYLTKSPIGVSKRHCMGFSSNTLQSGNQMDYKVENQENSNPNAFQGSKYESLKQPLGKVHFIFSDQRSNTNSLENGISEQAIKNPNTCSGPMRVKRRFTEAPDDDFADEDGFVEENIYYLRTESIDQVAIRQEALRKNAIDKLNLMSNANVDSIIAINAPKDLIVRTFSSIFHSMYSESNARMQLLQNICSHLMLDEYVLWRQNYTRHLFESLPKINNINQLSRTPTMTEVIHIYAQLNRPDFTTLFALLPQQFLEEICSQDDMIYLIRKIAADTIIYWLRENWSLHSDKLVDEFRSYLE